MKFKELKIGDKFWRWGDLNLKYPSPEAVVAIKAEDNLAIEVEKDGQFQFGVRFYMNGSDEINEYFLIDES